MALIEGLDICYHARSGIKTSTYMMKEFFENITLMAIHNCFGTVLLNSLIDAVYELKKCLL